MQSVAGNRAVQRQLRDATVQRQTDDTPYRPMPSAAGYSPLPNDAVDSPMPDAGYSPFPNDAVDSPMPSGPAYDPAYQLSPDLPPSYTAMPGAPAPAAAATEPDHEYQVYRPMAGGPAASAAASPSAPAGPERPAPLKLPEKFKDEDKKVGWRATYGMDMSTLSPEQQQQRAAMAERTSIVTKYNSPEEVAANTLTPSGEG
ncbi:MAG: hypothetical protein O2798_04730 [Chloroflexi bacterium]|nr:hypothetical protein [Chloroflexota bacterium]MDA1240131.1 hypothetical protein [Chloroflexota bacterium]